MSFSSPEFENTKVGIIGLGNVGWAFGRGLRQAAHENRTIACDRNVEKRNRCIHTTGITTVSDWRSVIEFADVILLCVRTDQVYPIIDEMRPMLSPSKTMVTLAAAVKLEEIRKHLPSSQPAIVRAVANINVAVRSGLTLVLRTLPDVTPEAFARVEHLFRALGEVIVTDSESELDRLSVLSGCAPAVIAIFLEALRQFGVAAGFDAAIASEAGAQCMRASLDAMQNLGVDPRTFKYSVAAPGGIVQKLLESEQSDRISQDVVRWFDHVLQRITKKS